MSQTAGGSIELLKERDEGRKPTTVYRRGHAKQWA